MYITLIEKHFVLLILFVMPVVLLFILFAEPRVGKAKVPRLEGDSRSYKRCRHIYSLLAGTAAITRPLSWLMQQPQHSRNVAITEPLYNLVQHSHDVIPV